jgi:hypothetical protein
VASTGWSRKTGPNASRTPSGAKSSRVSVATTPGIFSAADASTLTRRACGSLLRRMAT